MGNGIRPTTRDTIYAWLNSLKDSKKISLSSPENPFLSQKKLHIMAVSNNPFISYQDKVFKNVLSCEGLLEKVSSLETVGPEASPKTTVGTHLDNLARWL